MATEPGKLSLSGSDMYSEDITITTYRTMNARGWIPIRAYLQIAVVPLLTYIVAIEKRAEFGVVVFLFLLIVLPIEIGLCIYAVEIFRQFDEKTDSRRMKILVQLVDALLTAYFTFSLIFAPIILVVLTVATMGLVFVFSGTGVLSPIMVASIGSLIVAFLLKQWWRRVRP
jgi:hypothetical protein